MLRFVWSHLLVAEPAEGVVNIAEGVLVVKVNLRHRRDLSMHYMYIYIIYIHIKQNGRNVLLSFEDLSRGLESVLVKQHFETVRVI
jgi:hypothetical protein